MLVFVIMIVAIAQHLCVKVMSFSALHTSLPGSQAERQHYFAGSPLIIQLQAATKRHHHYLVDRCKGGMCPPRGVPNWPPLIPGAKLHPEKAVHHFFPSNNKFVGAAVHRHQRPPSPHKIGSSQNKPQSAAAFNIGHQNTGSFSKVAGLTASGTDTWTSANMTSNSAIPNHEHKFVSLSAAKEMIQKKLSWAEDHVDFQDGTLTLGVGNKKRTLLIGFFKPNLKNQKCRTPRDEPGHCRFLHYCILPTFASDHTVFESYACVVQKRYVGVCCPESVRQSSTEAPLMGDTVEEQQNENDVNPTLQDEQTSPAINTTDSCHASTHAVCGIRPSREEVIREESVARRIVDTTQTRRNHLLTAGPVICSLLLGRQSPGCKTFYPGALNTSRIVGGIESRPLDWPWMAALIRLGSPADTFCGGVLISHLHVLTAAHCVAPFLAEEIRVRVGEHDFGVTTDSDHEDIPVLKMVRHPAYNTGTFENDLAVVTLARTAKSCSILPVCLPENSFQVDAEGDDNTHGKEKSMEGKNATVIGWGTLAFGGRSSRVLRETTLPIWDTNACDAAYPQTINSDVQICAGHRDGTMKDACQGDSGGPLMIKNQDRWVLIGIVSYGVRCADPNYPGVYTRVDAFVDWLAHVTAK